MSEPHEQDPRTKPWAFITDGRSLYEVVACDIEKGRVTIENCKSFVRVELKTPMVCTKHFRLVTPSPDVAPDHAG